LSDEAAADLATTEAEAQARGRKAASRGKPRLRADLHRIWKQGGINLAWMLPIPSGKKSNSGNAVFSSSSDHHASCINELQAALACVVASLRSPIIGFYRPSNST
jgi:hypothetical protein